MSKKIPQVSKEGLVSKPLNIHALWTTAEIRKNHLYETWTDS